MTKEFSLSETSTIGLLGAGLAGGAIAARLRGAGFAVAGYDPAPEARQRLGEIGGVALADAGAVAEAARRLVLSLPGPAEVREVMAALAGRLRPGDVVIDTTTGDPESVEAVAGELAARGVEYVDATLGGSSRQIAAGEALVLCGATAAGLALAAPVLGAISSRVTHTGPPGTGTRMKLVLNMALGLQRAVLAETLEFARRSGVDPGRALEVLQAGPAYARVMDTKGQKMLRGEFTPEARLAQHWKDVRLMLASGRANGARLPLTAVHEALLAEADAAGWGPEDNSAIVKVFQEWK